MGQTTKHQTKNNKKHMTAITLSHGYPVAVCLITLGLAVTLAKTILIHYFPQNSLFYSKKVRPVLLPIHKNHKPNR